MASGSSVQRSVAEITFITNTVIPSGQEIYKATDTQGFIQIDFRSTTGT